ncbi:hypothetical protein JTB14_000473 [Gonioctena quinquepunctata]|nr:hypothetical protein JTB14_000473 [Gonioctena quinquepunctata]
MQLSIQKEQSRKQNCYKKEEIRAREILDLQLSSKSAEIEKNDESGESKSGLRFRLSARCDKKNQIQSIEGILKGILKSRYPPEHVILTVLLECENISNSWPLTHVSIDSDDAESLNHFPIGPSDPALPVTETEEEDLHLVSLWRAARRLADIFWSRWTEEYLPTPIKSGKWFRNSREKGIHVGDVVIMDDPDGLRNLWQKAVVIIYQAKDGRMRIVDVRNSNHTVYRRHVSQPIVLDVKK